MIHLIMKTITHIIVVFFNLIEIKQRLQLILYYLIIQFDARRHDYRYVTIVIDRHRLREGCHFVRAHARDSRLRLGEKRRFEMAHLYYEE